MTIHKDWCPSRRTDIVLMARTWISVFTEDTTDSKEQTVKKYAAWGIPAETFTEFGTTFGAAEEALRMAQEKETCQKPMAFGLEFAA